MAASHPTSERATQRTVILLGKSDKLKLERMARRQKVSSAEIVRRLIRSGDQLLRSEQEQEVIGAALKMIAAAVFEANASLSRSIDRLDELHQSLAPGAAR